MKQTVAEFILRRLKEVGVDHIFGVPGDFVLGLMNNVLKSDIELICTCNELNAAYAADAYARIKGVGCVATTYAVGELSAINGVAGSFAESVPVVKLTGAPAQAHFQKETLLHHTLGDYNIPKKMFSLVTGANVLLSKPDKVVEELDKVLHVCLAQSTPVYVAVCTDIIEMEITTPDSAFKYPVVEPSDPEALQEAVNEALTMLMNSNQPVALPGLDLIRSNMQADLREFLEKSGIPYATMMLGKCVLEEEHPQFIGLYVGARSRAYVAERVDNSDCIIVMGERMTDFNTGGFSTGFDPRKTIRVERDAVKIKFHVYHNVRMLHFVQELTKRLWKFDAVKMNIVPATKGCTHRRTLNFEPKPKDTLTMARVFDRVSHFLPEKCILIAETGTSLFAAAELMLPKGSTFMGQTFYGSIGYTVGATLGACIAAPERQVVLFVGDGSFQVTAQDLSTMIRYNCKPLVFLVNNDGYLIERVIVDRKYNDVQPWKYHMLPQVFGGGKSFEVRTEEEFEKVLEVAKTPDELIFAELFFAKWDCNEALKAAGRQMALTNRLLSKEEEKLAKEQK